MSVIVKNTSTFLVLLTALLLFQSVWNVAAAFCNHETVTSSKEWHLGHHVSGHAHTAHAEQAKSMKIVDTDDHSDHLPSFAPIILASETMYHQHRGSQMDAIRHLDWNNSYQSPYLEFNSPPPMLTPL